MTLPTRYQLYYSIRSPFARRIRIAMGRLGLKFEPREMDVFDPPADLLAANPLALVPVLVVSEKPGVPESTFSLPDSSMILEYLHENYAERIWPKDLALRARVRAASALATGLMTDTVRWFLEQKREAPSAEWGGEAIANIERTLAAIAAMPLKSPPWKVSDLQLTQAGYDLMVALEYLRLRLKGVEWEAKYPELVRFVEQHRVRQDLAPTSPPA